MSPLSNTPLASMCVPLTEISRKMYVSNPRLAGHPSTFFAAISESLNKIMWVPKKVTVEFYVAGGTLAIAIGDPGESLRASSFPPGKQGSDFLNSETFSTHLPVSGSASNDHDILLYVEPGAPNGLVHLFGLNCEEKLPFLARGHPKLSQR